MRFDWYAATVPVPAEGLLSCLSQSFGGSDVVRLVEGRGLHGYRSKVDLLVAGDPLCHVLHGGPNGSPHAWASGAHTEPFVAAVRSAFPVHRVSRFDSAEDFDEPGAFRRLAKLGVQFAKDRDLKVHHVGDWLRGVDGRTLYIGSRKSDVFVRLYEKGKQVRELVDDETGEIVAASPDWVRLEVQVRPQREAKLVAASSTPAAAWGFSAWTRDLARQVSGLNVERVTMQARRPIPYRESFKFMLAQYHSVILEVLQRDFGGDRRALGDHIGRQVLAEEEARASRSVAS